MKANKICLLCVSAPLALSASVVPALGLSKVRLIREDDNIIPIGDLNIDENNVLHGLKVAPSQIYQYDTLQIPANVTKIAPFAFAYIFDSAQTRINTVDFSKATSLEEIGDNAFNYCHGLTCDIDLTTCPQLKYIGKNCFFYCFGIKSIQLNDNVKNLSIADHAFLQCTSIQELTIPNGVVDIGNNAFEKCEGLKKIDLSKMQEFPSWLLSSSWIFNQAGSSQINDDQPQTILINYCGISPSQWASILNDRQHLSTSWTITSAYATNADSFTYSDSETKKVISGIKPGQTINALVIPSGVTKIEKDAFANYFGHGKVPVIFDKELTEIGDNAFSGCTGLYGDLELPYNLTSIGAGAFEGCTGLSGNVVIPNGVKELKDKTFYGSGITGVTFHTGVDTLGKNVFTNCSGLSWFDMSAFKTSDTIKWKTQSKLEEQPFFGLSQNGAISILEEKRNEVYGAFSSLGMGENITDGKEEYGKWMMHSKSDVGDKVYPSEWFTTIDKYKLMGFKQDFAEDKILSQYGIIKTPQTTLSIGKEAFKSKLVWQGRWRLILNEGLKIIKESAFENNSGFYGNLVLPHTIKEIGKKAFYSCTDLQGTLVFPSPQPIIGEDAFGRTSLKVIQFPENLTLASDSAFVINSANQTLDFSKVSSIDSLKFSPWIRFEADARGVIIAKDETMVSQLNKYFTRLQEKFNIGFNANNWKIVEAK